MKQQLTCNRENTTMRKQSNAATEGSQQADVLQMNSRDSEAAPPTVVATVIPTIAAVYRYTVGVYTLRFL